MSDIIEVFPASNGLTSEQVAQAVALLRAGGSYAGIARQLATTHQRIARIADRFGIQIASVRHAGIESATREAADFAADRRLADVNLLARKIREHLDSGDLLPAKDLRDLSVALGVAIDKRRLEDGQSTSNQSVQTRVWSARSVTPPAE